MTKLKIFLTILSLICLLSTQIFAYSPKERLRNSASSKYRSRVRQSIYQYRHKRSEDKEGHDNGKEKNKGDIDEQPSKDVGKSEDKKKQTDIKSNSNDQEETTRSSPTTTINKNQETSPGMQSNITSPSKMTNKNFLSLLIFSIGCIALFAYIITKFFNKKWSLTRNKYTCLNDDRGDYRGSQMLIG